MPSAIEELHRKWKDRGLAVVAINIQESRDTVAKWVRSSKLTVPVLLDPDGAVTQRYRVTATPTVFVVNRDGQVIGLAQGTKAWTSDRGQALIEALVGTKERRSVQ